MDPTWTASDAAPPPPRDMRPYYPEPASLAQVPAQRHATARTLVVAGALAGVTAIALAVAMMGGPPTGGGSSSSGAANASTTASALAALAPTAAGSAATSPDGPPQPVPYPSLDRPAGGTTPATTGPAAHTGSHAARAGSTGPMSTAGPAGPGPSADAAAPAAAAGQGAAHEVCLSCGTVASVKAVSVAGQATGVGAVGGGAAGALVGSQVAGRGNHTLGAIFGAIGGGLLGHHVEKQARSTTVYDVRVHMEDGTWRTVRQAKAPKVGARVDVSGQTLRPLSSANTV